MAHQTFYTTAEAASFLASRGVHVSHRTMETWRQRGDGPRFLKAAGRVLYHEKDLEQYLELGPAHPHPHLSHK